MNIEKSHNRLKKIISAAALIIFSALALFWLPAQAEENDTILFGGGIV